MTIYSICKNNPPDTSKQVVNEVDLGHLEIEKDFPEKPSALPYKRKETNFYQMMKKSNKKFILKRG